MRRGISLLEVLISMFVLLVGVVSVFSLIALGRFEMLEGSKADRAMAVARSAQREMLARGLLRPLASQTNTDSISGVTTTTYLPMWMDTSTPALSAWGPGSPTVTATTPWWPVGTTPALPFDASAVNPIVNACALDPLCITANTPASTAAVFPAYLNNAANTLASGMKRITMRAGPIYYADTSAAKSIHFGAMTVGHADLIFRSQDDLVLAPLTGNSPPMQQYSSSAGTLIRRQSTGDYSWLATIVPTQGDTRTCTVSVVVFYKRNFLLPGAAITASVAPPERMVSLIQASGNTGLGGGDVILSCPTTLTADYIKVRPNQWILLSQTPALPGWWRWYRVTATSDPVSSSGNWVRAVTLAGPDWNPNATYAGNPVTTNASIFDDAIGVYERNIQLEEPGSVWSPN